MVVGMTIPTAVLGKVRSCIGLFHNSVQWIVSSGVFCPFRGDSVDYPL
jgi:hypothetical protein